ncbi:MAG: hypothetical protein ACAI35_13065, partial [Candidatus Methylacidiphilales bacterium]|nr:hypothetical protein [Candidatus Methylacidiphilales bacterium]
AEIDSRMARVEAALESNVLADLKAATRALDEATQPLATLIFDAALEEASRKRAQAEEREGESSSAS